MPLRLTLFALVFAFFASSAAAAEPAVRYTPPEMGRSAGPDLYEKSLARPLLLLEEPSLWTKFKSNPRIQTMRITMVPSNGIGAVARLEASSNGSAKLHVIDPNFQKLEKLYKGGADREILLTELQRRVVLQLGSRSVSELTDLIRESGFWTKKIDQTERRDAGPEPMIMDGTSYFIEASVAGRYKMVTRHGCWMEDSLKSIVQKMAALASARSLEDGC